jgi:uncharacterized Zn-binding protein involved in type VI secretion
VDLLPRSDLSISFGKMAATQSCPVQVASWVEERNQTRPVVRSPRTEAAGAPSRVAGRRCRCQGEKQTVVEVVWSLLTGGWPVAVETSTGTHGVEVGSERDSISQRQSRLGFPEPSLGSGRLDSIPP